MGSVSVINAPESRYLIGGRVNILLWGYMALLGFGLGIGITLLELIMRPTLLNIQDVGDVFGLDILCEVAEDRAFFRKGRSLLIEEEQESETGEEFRLGGSHHTDCLPEKGGPPILFTSPPPCGERERPA